MALGSAMGPTFKQAGSSYHHPDSSRCHLPSGSSHALLLSQPPEGVLENLNQVSIQNSKSQSPLVISSPYPTPSAH